MKLRAKTYNIVKASRDELARSVAQIESGAVPNVSKAEASILRGHLMRMNALIDHYEKSRVH